MKRFLSLALTLCLFAGLWAAPASAMTQQELLERIRQTMASPTPAPTATPAPTEAPAAEGPGTEEAPAPAEEPGTDPAPAEDGGTADSSARPGAAAFRKGYVEVTPGLRAYRSASSKAQPAGVFGEKGCAFALRVNDAWLETAFVNAANKAVTVVYVRAADVTPLSDQAAAALLLTLGKAPKYEGYPLPAVQFGAEQATEPPTPAPMEEPTPEPTAEPTPEPASEPTPVPSEAPAAPAEAAETLAEDTGAEDGAAGEVGADETPGEALSAETGEDEAEEDTAEPGEEQPEDGAEAGEEGEAEAEGEEVVINASGTCGGNLTWTLSGGTLTISGTGKMNDYNDPYSSNHAPWYSYRSSIKTVDIKNGVTSIGRYAFYDCDSLTSVTIPSSVTSIGSVAFSYCTSLTSVTIPSSVTSIASSAFSSCSSLMRIDVAESNTAYSSQNGVLFNKDKTLLICCPGGKTGSYTIPSSVTSIGGGAFCECSSLTSVTIPSSVTSIGYEAFLGCYNLKSVYAESLQAWLNIVIYGDEYWDNGNPCCNGASLYFNGKLVTDITIPGNVTKIPSNAFTGCKSLTYVTIPNSVTSIGNSAFADCDSLTSVTIPNSVTSIDWHAFKSCSSLTSVTIPSSVTSIGGYAFDGCSSLTDVYYGGTVEQWNAISIEDMEASNRELQNATLHIVLAIANRASATAGDSVTIKASLSNNSGPLSYSWQFSNDRITWSDTILPGYNTDTLTFDATEARIKGRYYRCAITDTHGTWYTNPATIGWSDIVVTASADKTLVRKGDSVTFSTNVSGTQGNVSYQWQYSNTPDDEASWIATGLDGAETAALTFSATQVMISGRAYRCAVTDDNGTWYTNVVTVGWSSIELSAAANRQIAKKDDPVTIRAAVTGASGSVTYRWQYSTNQTSWYNTSLTGYDTAALSFAATKLRIDGRYYRCSVTDSTGTWYTNAVLLEWSDVVATASADRVIVHNGDSVTYTANVSGTQGNVTYQWQFSNTPDAEASWKATGLAGAKTAALTFDAIQLRVSGRAYRCAVTDDTGIWYTNAVTVGWSSIELSAAANRQIAKKDDPVTIRATVTGTFGTVAYRWQYSANQTSWYNTTLTGYDTAALSFAATKLRIDGRYYRCSVTDSTGTWYTNAVLLEWSDVVATASADSAIVHKGDSVTYTATVSGTQGNVAYQWQFSNTPDAETSWKATGLAGAKTAALTFDAIQLRVSGRAYRCAVTDDTGTWYTNAVTVGWSSIELSAAANRQIAKKDDPVTIRAAVTGTSGAVTYRWQYSVNQTSWHNTTLTGYDTAVLSFVAMKIRIDGRYYRCAVTDSTGTWYTNAVLLGWSDMILSASADKALVRKGDSVTFTANVSGTQGNVAYQWQFSNTPDAESGWNATSLTGAKTTVLTFNATQLRVSGRAYRCAVTDDSGTWYTNAVTVGWSSIELSASANRQIAKEGDPVAIRAAVTGTAGAVTYCWQYSTDQTSWSNTTLTGYDTAVLSFSATKTLVQGCHYRCAVTDDTGTWYTNAVLLSWTDVTVTASVDKKQAVQGDPLTFTAEVTGTTGEVSYQWQYSDTPDTDAGWWPTGLPGNKTDTLTFTATEVRIFGRGYRCAVTDDNGIWYSNPVNVTWVYSIASGTCGESLTWTLDNTGVLTVSGTGAMDDWSSSSAPWYEKRRGVISVVIKAGVTSIGENAFNGYTSLTSVTIPNSVTAIGGSAFYQCSGLTGITIPDSVTAIGDHAFYCCTGLTGVTLPGSLAELGSYAFYRCAGLTGEIVIPAGVTGFGSFAFYQCTGLTSVTISAGVTAVGGSAFAYCAALTDVTIPNSVTNIGSSAFSACDGLTAVTIPGSVKNIGSYAFSSCTGLTRVTIQSGVISIGSYAFSDCSGLSNVTIPTTVTGIGSSAFYGCSGLKKITIPGGVTNIGSYAFGNCTAMTEATLHNGVSIIGSSAFYGCSSLTSVRIPISLTWVENNAFGGCTALTDVYYGGTAAQWASVSIGSDNASLRNATLHPSST